MESRSDAHIAGCSHCLTLARFLARARRLTPTGPTRMLAERGRKKREMDRLYDETALKFLLGYGRAAYERSGGICQLCGWGRGPDVEFDLWWQFTIEHPIGRSQGCYPDRIRSAVDRAFPQLGEAERQALASQIHGPTLSLPPVLQQHHKPRRCTVHDGRGDFGSSQRP
jgi:hypothetical protein